MNQAIKYNSPITRDEFQQIAKQNRYRCEKVRDKWISIGRPLKGKVWQCLGELVSRELYLIHVYFRQNHSAFMQLNLNEEFNEDDFPVNYNPFIEKKNRSNE